MKRFVRWYKETDGSEAKLQYKDGHGAGWESYMAHDHYPIVGEYSDRDGSKGFKMFQYLLGQGYQALDPDGNEVK